MIFETRVTISVKININPLSYVIMIKYKNKKLYWNLISKTERCEIQYMSITCRQVQKL